MEYFEGKTIFEYVKAQQQEIERLKKALTQYGDYAVKRGFLLSDAIIAEDEVATLKAEIEQLKSTLNGCDKCMFFNNVREDAMNSLDLRSEISRLKQKCNFQESRANKKQYMLERKKAKVDEQVGKIMRITDICNKVFGASNVCRYMAAIENIREVLGGVPGGTNADQPNRE
jgi:chromosome segregation ATPase